jgi:isopentenyl-diphosphate Delta-isomerase
VADSIDVGGGLREDEVTHVFAGIFNGDARPDPAEVCDWRWMSPEALFDARRNRPHEFTPWFGLVFDQLRRAGLLPSKRCDPT